MNDIRQLTLEYQKDPENTEARDTLVTAYTPLLKKIARHYAQHPQDRDDLVQAGQIGLLKALPKWDQTRFTLGAYARKAVIGAIQDAAYELYAHLTVRERQRGDAELNRANATVARLDAELPGGPEKEGRPITLGDGIPDGAQRGSRMFDNQWKRLLRADSVVDRAAALVRAFDWDTPLHDRNCRIVVSRWRDVELARLLDGLDERRHLPPVLTNRRVVKMTDYRFPTDRHAEQVGGPGAALVLTVVGEYDEAYVMREMRRAAMSAWLKERPRPTLSAAREAWKQIKVVAAESRLGVWWDWPYPGTVAEIARALGVSRQAIYNILDEYEQALIEIRAEESAP